MKRWVGEIRSESSGKLGGLVNIGKLRVYLFEGDHLLKLCWDIKLTGGKLYVKQNIVVTKEKMK